MDRTGILDLLLKYLPLLIPVLVIQLGFVVYALVDLARRKKVHGPRLVWAVLLVLTAFEVPLAILVAGIYLAWGRQVEEAED